MNLYKAFYAGMSVEVSALTLYEAKKLAVAAFKPSKKNEGKVAVVLVAVDGKPVVHVPDF